MRKRQAAGGLHLSDSRQASNCSCTWIHHTPKQGRTAGRQHAYFKQRQRQRQRQLGKGKLW